MADIIHSIILVNRQFRDICYRFDACSSVCCMSTQQLACNLKYFLRYSRAPSATIHGVQNQIEENEFRQYWLPCVGTMTGLRALDLQLGNFHTVATTSIIALVNETVATISIALPRLDSLTLAISFTHDDEEPFVLCPLTRLSLLQHLCLEFHAFGSDEVFLSDDFQFLTEMPISSFSFRSGYAPCDHLLDQLPKMANLRALHLTTIVPDGMYSFDFFATLPQLHELHLYCCCWQPDFWCPAPPSTKLKHITLCEEFCMDSASGDADEECQRLSDILACITSIFSLETLALHFCSETSTSILGEHHKRELESKLPKCKVTFCDPPGDGICHCDSNMHFDVTTCPFSNCSSDDWLVYTVPMEL
eukprot:GILK01009772.1.p1 GENE.GILK01009772.1~~GILK01009772.1.p1  ORF type:complete len:394 (+),score=16.24 GILK01009772.1:97-1182(+)